MDYNIIMEKQVRRNGKRVCKRFPDRNVTLTYAELEEKSRRTAAWLQTQGFQKGDVLAVWMGNVPEYIILMAAALRNGCIFVPLSIYESTAQIEAMCTESGAGLLIYDSGNKYVKKQLTAKALSADLYAMDVAGFSDLVRTDSLAAEAKHPLRCELDMHDSVMILYTSGSTGKKKGICKNSAAVLGKRGLASGYIRLMDAVQRIRRMRVYNLCPWYHNTGMMLQMLMLMGLNFEEVTMEQYNPATVAKCLQEFRPVIWLGTASMLYRCCIVPEAQFALPVAIISTGEALSEHIAKKFQEMPGGGILYSGYGTTEAGGIAGACYRFRNTTPWIRLILWTIKKINMIQGVWEIGTVSASTDGILLGHISKMVSVLICDPESGCAVEDGMSGEICVATSRAMTGYVADDAMDIYVKHDGQIYLKTGDLGFKKDNILYLTGRQKQMILRSGENIIPHEIECEAEVFPGVGAAIACGIPSEAYGEDICLCVEISGEPPEQDELVAHLSGKLPKYMVPQYILYWTDFPLTNTGKLDRKALKTEAEARISAMKQGKA